TRLISAGSAVQVRPPAPFDAPPSRLTRDRKARSWRATPHVECPERAKRVERRPRPPDVMDPLFHRIRRYISEHDLIPADARVVAAVSGGSDSVALACILRELHNRHELCLAGLAHFNHRLRPTADRD